MEKKNNMNKNIVPEGFSIAMATVDLVPVIFFGITFWLVGQMIRSPLVFYGTIISTISGLIKAIWKYIVVIKRKNVWWMFLQMRIAMPIGMLLIIIGFIVGGISNSNAILRGLIQMPCLIFTLLGLMGMGFMFVFAAKLDSSDPKTNWKEQIVNSIAQFSFLVAVVLLICLYSPAK